MGATKNIGLAEQKKNFHFFMLLPNVDYSKIWQTERKRIIYLARQNRYI